MNAVRIVKIAALGLGVAAGIQGASLHAHVMSEERLARGLCESVSNFLETGSIREAYEGLERGLTLSGYAQTCVAVIDNGRSFAPNCLDETVSYDTSVCKAEANQGVRAEIHFRSGTWVTRTFFLLWVLTSAALLALASLYRVLASRLIEQASTEFRARLLAETPIRPGRRFGRIVDAILLRSGVARSIQEKVSRFEEQLKRYEHKIRADTALRTRQELEADRQRDYVEKVKQIRHDIRSPLSSLLALQETLTADPLQFKAISSAIKRIKLLIDDLEEFDRREDAPVLTILEVVAEEAVSMVRPRYLSAKGVRVLLKYNAAMLSPSYTVPEALRGVLENLLENAFDAASVDGVIDVEVRGGPQRFQIIVEDCGSGIPSAILPKLFTKGGTFGKVNGIGLGLYHAKQKIESWGGQIRCEPLARGTRFVIELPPAQVGVAFVGLAGLGKLIVIDDDPAVEEALRESGFLIEQSVSNFEAGQDALSARISTGTTALVDYKLGPKRYGTELIEALPERGRVVLCTNDFDDSQVLSQAKHLGIRILPKPLCFLVAHQAAHVG